MYSKKVEDSEVKCTQLGVANAGIKYASQNNASVARKVARVL